ncbi:MAG: T9SS type A sorting domain-containing protein [Bacteroidales bacterium]|nr:T9SS type A sorting domain-containing protein [Bacteroidales bacterium]
MKRLLLCFCALTIAGVTVAQNRAVARGADPGELYVTGTWYMIYGPGGPPHYDSIQKALFRLTENGKKLTVQYAASYFYSNPETTVIPSNILADAKPGVVYMKADFSKNSYPYTMLWVSFDYGKYWTFREENIGGRSYHAANVEGVLYRGNYGEVSKSIDYGQHFILMKDISRIGKEAGLNDEEFFYVTGSDPYQYKFWHTNDLYLTCTEISIDSQFIFGSMGGISPDVYRGGLPGEVYIDSWFPDSDSNPNWTYKVSFSADTGQTFRHVYISEPYGSYAESFPAFMTDREPGVFYVIKCDGVEDFDPWGSHLRICVEHYTDYGETLAGIYCHDVTKDYVNDVGIAEMGEVDCVVVYPNPTGGILSVETHNYASLRNIEIFDIFGRNVLSVPVETHGRASLQQQQSTTIIDMSHLPSGMYFVRVATETGTVVRKVVKR